ncbi:MULTISPECIES: DUF3135 domain-containing protein [unclassified Vibrio]|uniref:DUF3135 domain-containing protein n=1 Tax=Vibrio sp. HB236076 TaxID=3232307 RepID=A0AB39HDF1_9VIBR|nr:DUF3135 domain-containing protein [Vibrio sp. HB161653]MDP5255798.1 DUF3135 domain-containing protein [Vibrio sp. HB161653]
MERTANQHHQTTTPITLPSFDELMVMAQQDPVGFDRFRQRACLRCILASSLPMRERLIAQQNHINRLIQHCKNPVHTNMVLMQELQKQVAKLKKSLEVSPAASTEQPSADVIDFAHMSEKRRQQSG